MRKIGKEHRMKSQKSPDTELTFVSIHIRRTDYVHLLEINGIGHPEVSKSYFDNAMQFFRERFEVIHFSNKEVSIH